MAIPTSLKRILRSGFEKFSRDRSSTGAALVVMMIALFVVSFLFVLEGMSDFTAEKLQGGVDVSAYFKDTVSEEEIFDVREQLLALQEVSEAEYVSKEEALRRFIDAHQDDETILGPLDALGRNPLHAHLNVKARDSNDYSRIAEFLAKESFTSVIANIDFYDRAPVIEQIALIVQGIRAGAMGIVIALSAITILVAFNTIRLTIYNAKEEIEIMRLVGASNWFIRGPFLVQGVFVGVLATVTTLVIVFAVSALVASSIEDFSGFNVQAYLASHLFTLLLLLLVVGIGLGAISSTIAIRRYLQV